MRNFLIQYLYYQESHSKIHEHKKISVMKKVTILLVLKIFYRNITHTLSPMSLISRFFTVTFIYGNGTRLIKQTQTKII